MDFPILPKLVLYEKGVDEVEEKDPYAAALCSAHYSSFLSSHPSHKVKYYLMKEEERRNKILSSLPNISSDTFNKHLAILQFSDNISLYICLNEPGVNKAEEHRFFRSGIPIDRTIDSVT